MSVDAAALIREQATFVWRVLRHMGVSEAQLPDVSQEVFLVVLRQLQSFEGRSSLRTWIYGICRNVAQRARVRQQREIPLGDAEQLSETTAPDRALWLKQAHAELVEALASLDEAQRAVFLLYELEELPMEEVAQALNAPLTTCYSRLQIARQKVEQALRRNQQRAAFRAVKGGAR